MKVKEAIEFLRLYKYDEPCQESEAIKDIISLLKQGEAYKQMWEELEREYEIPQEPEDVKYTRRSILNKIKRIADKYYFKSEKTKDTTFIETEIIYRIMWKRAKRVFQFRGYHKGENYYIKFMKDLEQKYLKEEKDECNMHKECYRCGQEYTCMIKKNSNLKELEK